MRRAKDKSHLVFWALGIFLIALQVLFTEVYPNSTLAINIHDTYFVIPYAHLCNVLGTWFILCGLGYWILKLKGIKIIGWMFWLHFIFTLLFPINLGIMGIDLKPGIENLELYQTLQSSWFFGLILFVLGQIIYFLNVLISTLKKLR